MYSIVGSDGNTYGPVDIETLKIWCSEGRLTRETSVIDSVSGSSMKASDMSDLASAFGPPMMSPPPSAEQPAYQTAGAAAQPGFQPGPNPYSMPPGAAPYMRPGMAPGAISEEDLKGFNWGAFSLNWIWGLNHKKPILLLVFLFAFIPLAGPFVNIGFSIWAGVNGNRWAWESGRFYTPQQLKDTERVWNTWGIVLFVLGIVIGVIEVILLIMAASSGALHPRTY